MLTRIVTAGLLAGVLAGLFVSALQHATTVPLILAAEVYENGGKPAAPHHSLWDGSEEPKFILAHSDAPAAAGAEANAWAPQDGAERIGYTTLATIGTAVGFALMLLAAMIASGVEISARPAALWGIAGFAATGLATGMGLPPELPGSAAADLDARQIWWIGTALATAAALWVMFRGGAAWTVALGIILLALPHLMGAPHPDSFASPVPAELAAGFVAKSLAVHAVLWTLTGALAGLIWQRMAARTETAAV